VNGLPRALRRDAGTTGEPPTRLRIRISAAIREQLETHCLAALPEEGCGLLLGHREDPWATVAQAWPAQNMRASVDRFEIAPETVLAADRAARAAGHLLLGAWHSHPSGLAVPSATDRAEAWPDWVYVIVGLADPARPELRAWRLLGEDFVEDEVEIE
jgi:desampylase